MVTPKGNFLEKIESPNLQCLMQKNRFGYMCESAKCSQTLLLINVYVKNYHYYILVEIL